jgi:hypothetical protein
MVAGENGALKVVKPGRPVAVGARRGKETAE